MRYRGKLRAVRVATWLAYAVLVATDLSRRGLPPWLAVSAGTLTLLLFLPDYLSTYWEIRPDRLVAHRLFRRSVMMFVEVVSLDPLTRPDHQDAPLPERIEILGVAGRRMLVETTDSAGFLRELLQHLPPIPLQEEDI